MSLNCRFHSQGPQRLLAGSFDRTKKQRKLSQIELGIELEDPLLHLYLGGGGGEPPEKVVENQPRESLSTILSTHLAPRSLGSPSTSTARA